MTSTHRDTHTHWGVKIHRESSERTVREERKIAREKEKGHHMRLHEKKHLKIHIYLCSIIVGPCFHSTSHLVCFFSLSSVGITFTPFTPCPSVRICLHFSLDSTTMHFREDFTHTDTDTDTQESCTGLRT